MESLSYFLSITAILWTTSGITRIATRVTTITDPDPGLKTLLVPLTLLSLIIFLDHLCLYGPDMDTNSIRIAIGFIRRSMGASWLYFCTIHYRLHHIDSARHRYMPLLVTVSLVVNCMYALMNAMVGSSFWDAASMITMVIMAFYAGYDAVFLVIRHEAKLPSSIAGVRIAMLTMIVYPVVFISDLAGVRFPGLSHARPMWSQTNPLYLLLLLFILELALRATGKPTSDPGPHESIDPFSTLSDREAETIRLIMQGKSYKEITVLLQITMPTVKSHVSNAYRKLGIRNRSQLYQLARS